MPSSQRFGGTKENRRNWLQSPGLANTLWNSMGARSIEAQFRRNEREAQRRQRELERRVKEQAKLSAIEQAKLEVESYENTLEVLLSVHKEQGKSWDWLQVLASLPPVVPQRS